MFYKENVQKKKKWERRFRVAAHAPKIICCQGIFSNKVPPPPDHKADQKYKKKYKKEEKIKKEDLWSWLETLHSVLNKIKK